MKIESKRFIGLDLAKRTMELCILRDGEKPIEQSGLKTDAQGRKRLFSLLRKSDYVAMEACAYAFLLTRLLINEVGCTVYILNPGKLQMIWRSTRKTDKADAHKLALFIQRNPADELPLVSLPSEKEEELRSLVSAKRFFTKTRTALINRLHALFVQAGFTTLIKSDLARPQARAKHITALSNVQLLIAQSIEAELTVTETQLAAFEEKINAIVRRSELAPYLMSIPGAGPAMTAAFLAYVGDGSRFSKASEVANYVGLVPVLDCSGNTSHYGSISKVGCGALRSIVLQAAWSVVKCKEGGRLKAKYVSLCTRMTKTKSATALARKIMILMWTLVRRREFYADASIAGLKRKFRGYHLDFSGWEDRAS